MNAPKLRYILFIVALLTGIGVPYAENSNIVIDSTIDTYRIYADKTGSRIGKVKHTSETTYRALRAADKAVAIMYYNNDITIDKTSGGTTSYGSYFSDDVFYSDSKACLMSVELKSAGASAKAIMERTFKNPDHFCTILLSDYYPIANATVRFIIPMSLSDIRVETANLDKSTVTHTTEEKGKERVITYRIESLPAISHTPRSPSINVTAPQLRILGPYKDVNDLYGRLYRYVTSMPDNDPDTVARLAREITSNATSDSARISIINDFVHANIRYKAIEHGEYGYIPDAPSEVLRKHYGDCKGSAGLIRGMLRAVGIDARFVWVGTENIATEWTEAPYLASGNHMIAAACTGDSLLYIDGTARHFGTGELPTPIQGRQTIVEWTPDSCIIDRIPVKSPDANSCVTSIHLSPNPDMSLSGTYSEVMTGEYNAGLRAFAEQTSPDKLNDRLLSYLSIKQKGARVTDPILATGKNDITITSNIELPNAFQAIGDEVYVNLNPYPRLSELLFDTKKPRTCNGIIDIRSSRMWEIKLDLPEGYSAATNYDPIVISNKWIDAKLDTSVSTDTIIRRLTLTVKERYIRPEEISQFNKDIKELANYTSALIPLIKSSNN